MREFLNKNGAYVAAGLIIIALAVWYVFGRGGDHIPSKAFFIDEDTGQESTRSIDDVPPLAGAKGNPSIVRVYKFNYEDDPTVRVGYYVKFPADMKAKMEDLIKHPNPQSLLEPGAAELIRKPDAGLNGWVKLSSAEGDKIVNALVSPSGKNPQAVFP